MENEIREREVVVDGKTLTLLRKDGKWVFPFVTYYQHGLGTPLCLALLAYVEDSNEFESEAVITVNLPGAERSAGCQFMTRTTTGKKFSTGSYFTDYVLLPVDMPFPVSASTPRWIFIRANASCSRKSFATGISTLLIDRQEKAVIRTAFMGLPASVLLYGYLSCIFFLFYPAFLILKMRVLCLRSIPFYLKIHYNPGRNKFVFQSVWFFPDSYIRSVCFLKKNLKYIGDRSSYCPILGTSINRMYWLYSKFIGTF